MAVINPRRWDYIMDPADYCAFAIVLDRGGPRDALVEGEFAASFIINPTPASLSVGLLISTESDKTPRLFGDVVYFWARFGPGANASPVFDAPGTDLGIEVTITINSGRTMQRTGILPAGQR